MRNVAIRVENLSKLYHIGQGKTAAYETLGERITDMLTGPLRSMRSVLQGQSSAVASDSIWALKDVSFEVNHGEVVGIIGRNGAGKSTLLKILSQITEPTEGHIDLYGRVGALLEVGTGFHPELTGRENVFLNGAILGMTRNDIQRKFDEIVAFSGVEKFIDTPVKHYSSGMQVRLAFAVAAHLEPEILVVDEVLAVGDAEFQRKCLGKMGDVTKEGRTVLFVSHNMAMIRKLCHYGILLANGQICMYEDTDMVVDTYEREVLSFQNNHLHLLPIMNQEYGVSLTNVGASIVQQAGRVDLLIEVQIENQKYLDKLGVGVWIHTLDGITISRLSPGLTNIIIENCSNECYCILECQSINRFLAHGEYYVSIFLTIPKVANILTVESVASFEIPPFDHFDSGEYFLLQTHGLVPLPFRVKEVSCQH